MELPSTEDLNDTNRELFGALKPSWNDFDADDELPMGRATMKARSREIVNQQGQGLSVPSPPGRPLAGADHASQSRYPPTGIENYRMQNIGASSGPGGYNPSGYGVHLPPANFAKPQPPPGPSSVRPLPPSLQQPPAAPSGTGWKLSDDMMNQPWGSVLRQLNRGGTTAR